MPFGCWNSFDLRFHDKERELAFLKYVETKLVTSTAGIAVLLSSAFLFWLGRELLCETGAASNTYSYSLSDVRSIRFVLLAFNSASPMVVLLFALLWFLSGRAWLNWELICVSMTTVVPVLAIIGNRYALPKLFGKDPDDAWSDGHGYVAANLVILLQFLLTVFCLFVPIRMHLKWIPVTITFLAQGACFAIWGTPDSTREDQGKLMIVFFISGCGTLWGAWFIERDARQQMLAQRSVNRKSYELEVQHAGASRILESLCDAVLELGSDFSILKQSPRLGALLFHPSVQDMTGKCFCDLIASTEDRARFMNALQDNQSLDKPMGSDMVQVHLRDYHGKEVSVYLYHARTFGLASAQCCHLVALVEAGEHALPDAKEILPIGITSDHGSVSSNSEMSIPLTAEASADIAVWVNVTNPSLDIVKCTPGFTVFGPMASGTSFCDIVEDSKAFAAWIQLLVNHQLNGIEHQLPLAVTLKLRTSQHSKAEYSARCAPDLGTLLDWDDDSDCNVLRLNFDRVKCKYRRSKGFSCNLNQGIQQLDARTLEL